MNKELFAEQDLAEQRRFLPLAARMRPQSLDDYVGQAHLLGEGGLLREALQSATVRSMILWGPPGVGKTTLAKLIANYCDAQFIELSAVLTGVKDIRAAVDAAKNYRLQYQKATILFVDEVHRFNKSQQDAFLPHIENGDVIFIGATTENPSFELNSALLSRARVYVLKPLENAALEQLLNSALQNDELLQQAQIQLQAQAKEQLIQAADGDARRLLNLLELAADLLHQRTEKIIDTTVLKQVLSQSLRRFDKGGEQFYDQISALHKSIRGSAPDAALYWLCRMLDGGCDPLYLARRLVRIASEDIGNADPRALTLAMSAWDVQQRLGSPEGELALAQCTIYLAVAAKSNAVYSAYNAMRELVKQTGTLEVPLHLRNAPTSLLKELDYGAEYRYAHDEEDGFAAGENYFPESLKDTELYQPVNRGLEIKIQQKIAWLKSRNQQSLVQRYKPDGNKDTL